MGIDFHFDKAFAKAQIAANQRLPRTGTVFISMNDMMKDKVVPIAKGFQELGFKILSTDGTAAFLEKAGVQVEKVLKLHEGRPHAADLLANGDIQLMIITSSGDALDQSDGRQLRRMALAYKVPIITTIAGAVATLQAVAGLKESPVEMMALQDFFVKDVVAARAN
jgi:carbamoyl-phosphate synthase large subunit